MNPSVSALLQLNPLFVFAMADEATHLFDGRNTLFTGLGKINAAYQLTRRLAQTRPGIIVNLGSAGSAAFDQGAIVCCTRFVQRDMDVTPLGVELYKTPFSDIPSVLSYGLAVEGLPQGICGSGDNFEVRHTSSAYNVVDMEAYALALVAHQEQVPFLCLKHITDGADEAAAANWQAALEQTPAKLKAVIDQLAMS